MTYCLADIVPRTHGTGEGRKIGLDGAETP